MVVDGHQLERPQQQKFLELAMCHLQVLFPVPAMLVSLPVEHPLAGLQLSVSLLQPSLLSSSPSNGQAQPAWQPAHPGVNHASTLAHINWPGGPCRRWLKVHQLFSCSTGVHVYLIQSPFFKFSLAIILTHRFKPLRPAVFQSNLL